MKKLLIVGAGVLQVPAIIKGKELGYDVAVADIDPLAPGIEFADRYYQCSTIDKIGLLRVAEDYSPNGIMTTATDMPMRAISYIAAHKNLNCISEECAYNCTDKVAMIQCFSKHGVPCPKFYECENISDIENCDIAYPFIIKPADSSGSRGVFLINSIEELQKHYFEAANASRSNRVIIEEFMEGHEISAETFVVNGKAHVIQITDKITTGAPHFVETGHNQPTNLKESVCDEIKAVAQAACESVGLSNGPAHIEMMVTDSGVKMIEMGARLGGDCITSHLVPLSTGVDMVKQTILYAMNEPIDLNPKCNKAAAIRFLIADEGILLGISGTDKARAIPGVTEINFFHSVGERIKKVSSSGDRMGYIIAQGANIKEAITSCEKAKQFITFKIGELT